MQLLNPLLLLDKSNTQFTLKAEITDFLLHVQDNLQQHIMSNILSIVTQN